MITYAADDLVREVAYVAEHLHWSLAEILDLEHPLRRRFIEQIDKRIREADDGR